MTKAEQKLFYDAVVFEAVLAVMPDEAIYWPFCLSHAFWKAHTRDKAGLINGRKSVHKDDCAALIQKMHDIVNGNAELDRFKGFFIYYETQDIKNESRQASASHISRIQ